MEGALYPLSSPLLGSIPNTTAHPMLTHLPSRLGRAGRGPCACPASVLPSSCPLVAGLCLLQRTAAFSRPPQLSRNKSSSFCAVLQAEKVILSTLFFQYILQKSKIFKVDSLLHLPVDRGGSRRGRSWCGQWTCSHYWWGGRSWHRSPSVDWGTRVTSRPSSRTHPGSSLSPTWDLPAQTVNKIKHIYNYQKITVVNCISF